MFAIYDRATRSYYRGPQTPGHGSKRADLFWTASQARSEIGTMKSLGIWPLFSWIVVKLRSEQPHPVARRLMSIADLST